jgi:hypothetical protein
MIVGTASLPANIMFVGNGLAAVCTAHLATKKVLVAAAPASGRNTTRVPQPVRRKKAASLPAATSAVNAANPQLCSSSEEETDTDTNMERRSMWTVRQKRKEKNGEHTSGGSLKTPWPHEQRPAYLQKKSESSIGEMTFTELMKLKRAYCRRRG